MSDMGRGNPRFKEMELYEPVTFYIDLDEEFNFVYDDLFEYVSDRIEDMLRTIGLSRVKKKDRYVSTDVDMCSVDNCAIVLFENDIMSVCASMEDSRVVIGIIPINMDKFTYLFGLDDCDYDATEELYQKYISWFKDYETIFRFVLGCAFPGCIWFPTGPWTSGKLDLDSCESFVMLLDGIKKEIISDHTKNTGK